MKKNKPKIIFLGTPEFAVPALLKLINSNFLPDLVITQPDRPAGRKQELNVSPIKLIAQKFKIKVLQPENKKELEEILIEEKPDICILVAYGMIITQRAIDIPKFGFLNLHPSLLPAYRGSSPIQTAILNGDKQTGVTIIKLSSKVDAGPIVAQKEVPIEKSDNAEVLHNKLAEAGADLLIDILPKYLASEIKVVEQNDSQATFTKILKREDGQIKWQDSAQQIEQKFKAFSPWPGVFTIFNGRRLKIANLSVLEGVLPPNLVAGQVFLGDSHELAVACGQGAIEIKLIQPEGKNLMSSSDFLLGQKNIINQILV